MVAATIQQEDPPWLRKVNRNTSFSSVDSYGPVSSTDTSFEMGPQSLPTLTSQTSSCSISSSLSSNSSQTLSSTTLSSCDQSKPLGQLPKDIPHSRDSASDSSRPTATVITSFHPSSVQPKLEPAHTTMPPIAQVVYPITSKRVGAGEAVDRVGGILQTTGMKSILYSAGKKMARVLL